MTLPDGFRDTFSRDFGEETYDALLWELSEVPSPVSVRRNPAKLDGTTGSIPWCREGLLLDERPIFGADPLWHAGAYYVQEPASMAVAAYLDRLDFVPDAALDLCAAPGGKTTLLRSRLPEGCVLVANEPDRKRVRVLEENLLRWGAEETLVTCASPDRLLAAGCSYDLILVDAPCSGEGMFRKEEDAVTGWSPELVRHCTRTQREILRDAWQMLRENGLLIYSTCTYNREENESHLHYLFDSYAAEVVELPDLVRLGATESTVEQGVYRFFPHRVHSEGLTTFAVRKREGLIRQAPRHTAKSTRPSDIPTELSALPAESLSLRGRTGDWVLLSEEGRRLSALLEATPGVGLLRSGVTLGQAKGRTFVPDEAWVLSTSASAAIPYPRRRVSPDEAFALIGRQTLPSSGERGFSLITYAGVPLLVVKDLGSRVNILYPKAMALHDPRLTVADMPHIFDVDE